MEIKLNATIQKSYYGKAVIVDGKNGDKLLRSYQTIVCAYNPTTGVFRKLWNGYSRTTMNHINDFRRLYGLSWLSKKEWEKLSGENDNGERYKVEFSNGFVSWKAEVVFDDEDAACSFADEVCEKRNWNISACVIPA